jgi:sn-glycerol 3-phosphate transport system permease protein
MNPTKKKDLVLLGRHKVSPLPYFFIAPALILFGMFTIYPFLRTIALSFTLTNKYGNPTKFVGLKMWERVLTKAEFWECILTTLKVAGINLVGTFLIAMLFALLSTKQTPGGKIYQTMFALPMAIASSPAAAIFLFIFRQKNGLLNSLLNTSVAWLQNMNTAIWVVCLVTIWMHVGSSFIFLLVGFRNVPDELIESSVLDGANFWQRMWNVLLPVASPQIFFVLFLNISSSFKSFAQIKLLTQGGPVQSTTTLIYYIYKNAMIDGRFETACIQAIFLFMMIFVITRIQFALEKKVVYYQ